MRTQEFQELVWEYARGNTRAMPWRARPEPYYVLVSEMMLQQTQVERVIPKFNAFVSRFPDFAVLAGAPLADVLALWSGLGYNRRAKFLWHAAQAVKADFDGLLPQTEAQLVSLPGVGANTAGAVLAYAFNQPAVFVETNIRSVFFRHFFTGQQQVSDRELYEKVQQTLDREHPREWYWALMDYGAYLKKNGGANLSKGRHYRKQSPLKGSPREMRGRIIRSLVACPLDEKQLRNAVAADARFEPALEALLREELVRTKNNKYGLA